MFTYLLPLFFSLSGIRPSIFWKVFILICLKFVWNIQIFMNLFCSVFFLTYSCLLLFLIFPPNHIFHCSIVLNISFCLLSSTILFLLFSHVLKLHAKLRVSYKPFICSVWFLSWSLCVSTFRPALLQLCLHFYLFYDFYIYFKFFFSDSLSVFIAMLYFYALCLNWFSNLWATMTT